VGAAKQWSTPGIARQLSVESESPILSIDWGSYNSAAAVAMGKSHMLIKSSESEGSQGKAFPSFLHFDLTGRALRYGARAMRMRVESAEQVIWGVKRLIGLSYNEALGDDEFGRFAFATQKAEDGSILIRVGSASFSPTDICRMTLEKIKQDAESPLNLGAPIRRARLAIPAYFGIRSQEIVQEAKDAGFAEVETIIEPCAATFAYAIKPKEGEEYVLALSLGAGTFEVVCGLLTRNENDQAAFLAKGTSGHTRLGVMDFDSAILEYVLSQKCDAPTRNSIRNNIVLKTKLIDTVELAKIRLSSQAIALILLDHQGRTYIRDHLIRQELENVVSPIIEECRKPLVSLDKASMTRAEIDTVILIGGPMHMPFVREKMKQLVAFENGQLVNPPCFQ